MPITSLSVLRWSSVRQALRQHFSLLAWLIVGLGGCFVAGRARGETHALLAGIWLLVLAFICRRGIRQLFGPVFVYEALRLARHPRYLLARVAFAVLLAGLFTYAYFHWAKSNADVNVGNALSIHAEAELAETFFSIYMVVQFAMVVLLTPAFVAGAIAEEKERRTLEFMLATDLANREIVLGKLAARVGNMTLFLLAGLPVLSFVQFFGGVDPDRLVAGFAATLVTMLGLSAVSLFCSVTSRRTRDAVVLAYFLTITYLGASFILSELNVPGASMRATDNADVYAISIGNPVVAIRELEYRGNEALWMILGHLALFHAAVVSIFAGWSLWCFRSVALRQSHRVVEAAATNQRLRDRSAVGDDPMKWKECHVDSGLKITVLGRTVMLLVAGMSLALGLGAWRPT